MNQSGSFRLMVISLLRHTLQFAVGSALILGEKTQAFTQEAFVRGKEAQDQGRKLVQEMRSERAEPREINVDFALDRLNVPTRSDIQELNQRITELSQRIDEL